MDYGFEYKVCCGNCHVLTATKLLAAIESLGLLGVLIAFMKSENTLGLIYLLIKAVILACLFYALKADQGIYILPQIATILIDMGIIFVVLVMYLVEPQKVDSQQTHSGAMVLSMFIAFIVAEAWKLWTLMVAFRCYQYLKLIDGTEGLQTFGTACNALLAA